MGTARRLTLSEVVGHNARLIRGDRRADEVARAARLYGLKWNTGRVSDFEHGRLSPTVPTLLGVVLALSHITGRSVSLFELFECDEPIAINETLALESERLRAYLSGTAATPLPEVVRDTVVAAFRQASESFRQLPRHLDDVPIDAVELAELGSGESEQRAAKELGIDLTRMIHESADLWGHSFSAERDRRAGPDANAQKRGRVSRQLKDELKVRLSRGDD